jgi:hypothetical protein
MVQTCQVAEWSGFQMVSEDQNKFIHVLFSEYLLNTVYIQKPDCPAFERSSLGPDNKIPLVQTVLLKKGHKKYFLYNKTV